MPIPQRSFRYRPAYDIKTSWTAKPAGATLRDGTIVRMDGSDGLFAGKDFVVQGGLYYPRGGMAVLYDSGYSGLTCSSSTLAVIAGMPSTVFPFAYLASVPGAFFRSVMSVVRTSAANTQAWDIRLRWGLSGEFSLIRAGNQSPGNLLFVSGMTAYSPTAGKHMISGFGMSGWGSSSSTYGETEQNIADGAIALLMATGGAGETMTVRNIKIEYHAGAY